MFAFMTALTLTIHPRTTRHLLNSQLPRTQTHTATAKMPAPTQPPSQIPQETIWATASRAPSQPGVYRFLDATGKPLYIGKARRLRSRMRQYIRSDPTALSAVAPASTVAPRIAAMVAQARFLDYIVTESEAAALALEASLVQELRPRFNVLLKDDRRHPYALITFSEAYPRILVTRSRKKANAKDRLYGPFVDEGRLRNVLNAIHTAFPLRQRARRLFADRPCINYDLGRCPGVCQELIAPQEYANTIHTVDKLLSGRIQEVLDDLRQQMITLSKAMLYEDAAKCRDKITILENAFYINHPDKPSIHDASPTLSTVSAEVAAIVDLDPFVSRDVFSIATSQTVAKVVLFQVRGGKVISRFVFSAVPREGCSEPEDILSAVLSAHYSAADHPMEIPEEVVLASPASDLAILKSVLSEKRGKAVAIRPSSAATLSIVRTVQRNADLELDLESQRASDLARDLGGLVSFLSPYFKDLIPKAYEEDELPRARPQEKYSLATHTVPVDLHHEQLETPILRLHRIEGYDISHTSGSNAVGSMVVFLNGSPVPTEHRRYYLAEESSSQGHPDDYESIRETLKRRFKGLPIGSYSSAIASSSLPDLLVIDGGKGQLNAATATLEDLGLLGLFPVISIAKGQEEIFVPGKSESINYDDETKSYFMNDGIRLICRIRDEAHRIAVAAHRKRRGRRALRSGLDSVTGLGPMKRSALLDHFNGSSEAVAQASSTELQKAPGIGPALAKRVYNHFHTQSSFS